ncbi:MAG: Omp28-related outer membrane protein, partial [Crocinitomicaceae bacterium]|nr:Omp28-related outer membrane protein [Crocinitomicaceae bacterium]
IMKKILLCGSLLFATGAFSQVLTEDFEGLSGALPAGWASQSTTVGTGDWVTGNAALANTGGYWPVPAHGDFAQVNDDVCNCNLSAAYITTPSMDLTGLSGVILKYNFLDDLSYGGNPHIVEVSADGGATWTAAFTMAGTSASLSWQSNFIALGAATNGATDVKVRWKYDDGGAWATGLAIDDVVIEVPPANNAKYNFASVDRYALINTNSPLTVDVTNVGSNPITSLTIDWNDGTSHSQTITTNIAVGATITVSHPTNVTYATAVEENIAVTITMVNAVADGDPTDNQGTIMHNTLSQATSKNIVIEEGTGTWCGWCPRGAVAMDYMQATYTDFIGIAVHNGDPMTVTAYDDGAGITGFPGGNYMRSELDASVSQAAFEAYYTANINKGVPANVGVTVTGTGSNVTLDATATFYTPVSAGNFRLAVVMIEDGVTGTGAQWNQANYYSGGGQGAMGGYETLPDPVPAAQMVYDHVGVALLGGYDGLAGSVPATIVDGTVGTASFPYTIPASSTRDNMHAVALLLNNTTGEIMNAKSISIADGSSAGLAEELVANLAIFPNPASDIVNVVFDGKGGAYTVSISNIAGVTVSSTSLENAAGSQLVKLPVSDLASGVYIVTISSNGISKTARVVVR